MAGLLLRKRFKYEAMEIKAVRGSTIRPVKPSVIARPTTNTVMGVRKDLNGSLMIASRRRPFPNTVITAISPIKIPDTR